MSYRGRSDLRTFHAYLNDEDELIGAFDNISLDEGPRRSALGYVHDGFVVSDTEDSDKNGETEESEEDLSDSEVNSEPDEEDYDENKETGNSEDDQSHYSEMDGEVEGEDEEEEEDDDGSEETDNSEEDETDGELNGELNEQDYKNGFSSVFELPKSLGLQKRTMMGITACKQNHVVYIARSRRKENGLTRVKVGRTCGSERRQGEYQECGLEIWFKIPVVNAHYVEKMAHTTLKYEYSSRESKIPYIQSMSEYKQVQCPCGKSHNKDVFLTKRRENHTWLKNLLRALQILDFHEAEVLMKKQRAKRIEEISSDRKRKVETHTHPATINPPTLNSQAETRAGRAGAELCPPSIASQNTPLEGTSRYFQKSTSTFGPTPSQEKVMAGLSQNQALSQALCDKMFQPFSTQAPNTHTFSNILGGRESIESNVNTTYFARQHSAKPPTIFGTTNIVRDRMSEQQGRHSNIEGDLGKGGVSVHHSQSTERMSEVIGLPASETRDCKGKGRMPHTVPPPARISTASRDLNFSHSRTSGLFSPNVSTLQEHIQKQAVNTQTILKHELTAKAQTYPTSKPSLGGSTLFAADVTVLGLDTKVHEGHLGHVPTLNRKDKNPFKPSTFTPAVSMQSVATQSISSDSKSFVFRPSAPSVPPAFEFQPSVPNHESANVGLQTVPRTFASVPNFGFANAGVQRNPFKPPELKSDTMNTVNSNRHTPRSE